MGYNKLIAYGNKVEIYEYEKNLPERLGKNEIRNESRVRDEGMASGRNDAMRREERRGKRLDNARRATMAFRRLVASNLGKPPNPILITLTYAENIEDIKRGYKDFRSFIQRLRDKFGPSFRYIAVPEFQRRGAIHYHALFWGLPPDIYERERETRLVASLWAVGFVFIKQTDGDDRLSTYLSKYMSKAFLDERLSNQKAYTSSRNCLRPKIQSGFSPSWPVIEDWVGDNFPCKEKQFMTKWLGKGRFRLYEFNPN